MKTNSSNRAAEHFAQLSRRRFLRGLGACVALPALESLVPAATAPSNLAATTGTGAPLRSAFVYFPNGAIQPKWWPTTEGTSFELSPTLQALAKVRHQLQVLGGLDHVNATPGPDGACDQGRASGTFLNVVRV